MEISTKTITNSMTAMIMTSRIMPRAETAMKTGVAGNTAHTAFAPTRGPILTATRAPATVRSIDLGLKAR